MSNDKESSVAGMENHPPMLVESDYESCKIRIERYIKGKPLGKLIWKSIKDGPSPTPMTTVNEGTCPVALPVTREKLDCEYSPEERNTELEDIQAGTF